ncbi:MAG: TIGR00730 family Rossman fold protein [Phycisphaerales bacterium]|nr:TIGR00730 family Rossman fold protein [Phycisphaerales bacterium]
MKRVSVFCGSSAGTDPAYTQAAVELGRLLATKQIALVYGGGNIGLMGKIATATLEAGGHVIGVIPKFLMAFEIGKIELPDLRIVGSMHERKALMAELSDGFIALPGGFGTLEEFCEILTWGQLGLHAKPFGLLNVAGFYDHFLAFLDHAVERQLIKRKHRTLILTANGPDALLQQMKLYT